MDDVISAWAGTESEFRDFIDNLQTIHPNIRITMVRSNPLPALDMTLRLAQGRVVTDFYRKPSASDHVLQQSSAHGWDTKKNYMCNEFMRRFQRCSSHEDADRHLKEFSTRLISIGGYRKEFVLTQLTRAKRRIAGIRRQVEAGERPWFRSRAWRMQHQGEKRRGPPGGPVFWLPFSPPSLVSKVKAAVRAADLGIQVRVKAGQTLKSKLCNTPLEPLQCDNPRCKLCAADGDARLKPKCREKDVVYRCVCAHCNSDYIGETSQMAAKRFRQHLSSHTGSALALHHQETHPDLSPRFMMQRVGGGKGFVRRKCLEALVVHSENPVLNRRAEGRGVFDLYW